MIFFFKQKTAYEMRISDWSSDVCSSDLWPATRPCRSPANCADRRWHPRLPPGARASPPPHGRSARGRPDPALRNQAPRPLGPGRLRCLLSMAVDPVRPWLMLRLNRGTAPESGRTIGTGLPSVKVPQGSQKSANHSHLPDQALYKLRLLLT